MSRRSDARKRYAPYRSKFEYLVAQNLKKAKRKINYETKTIKYTKPATKHSYKPDFILANGIIVECKGRFVAADRKKHLYIQEQYPDLDIRFLFQRASNPLHRGSNTTYGDWCDKHGFIWAEGEEIPRAWLKEKKHVNK